MKAVKKTARNIADFRAAHDPEVIIPTKIRRALESVAAVGAENWEYESDFMKLAGISQTQIGQYRDQFAEHIVETANTRSGGAARRVWFGTKTAAAKARGA